MTAGGWGSARLLRMDSIYIRGLNTPSRLWTRGMIAPGRLLQRVIKARHLTLGKLDAVLGVGPSQLSPLAHSCASFEVLQEISLSHRAFLRGFSASAVSECLKPIGQFLDDEIEMEVAAWEDECEDGAKCVSQGSNFLETSLRILTQKNVEHKAWSVIANINEASGLLSRFLTLISRPEHHMLHVLSQASCRHIDAYYFLQLVVTWPSRWLDSQCPGRVLNLQPE